MIGQILETEDTKESTLKNLKDENNLFFFHQADQKIQCNYEASFQIYNRPRQLSVQNPVCKIEFPVLNTTTIAQNNFYSSNIGSQITQHDFSKMTTRSQNRNQRSTSFNIGHTFYQEQSKTCNLNAQANQQTDIQNKFFRYFKTQMRMRKDSLKQFSESTQLNQSNFSNQIINNDNLSQKSFTCQFSVDQKMIEDFTSANNEEVIDLNKNYLYEEGLDTIQDQEEINRLQYYELYKNCDKNFFTQQTKKLKNKKGVELKQVMKNELFVQEDISPWQINQRAQHFFQANQKKQEGRSACSTPYTRQSQIGFSKESDFIDSQKGKPAACTSRFNEQQGSDIAGSALNFYHNDESKDNNFGYLKAKSQLLSDPYPHIKQIHSINQKNIDKQSSIENKEQYNFAKRNSRQIQKKIIKMLVKQNQQVDSLLQESQNNYIQNQQEKDILKLLKPQKNKAQMSELNPIKGKENMPKFYNNLANIEMKKSALPKIQQQQMNLFKPNTIIFQSNQKYKSLFDNSSHNFNECITFLPKNLKNKILKQLKQQSKPIIFKKSLSPPGKVSKTPEKLNEPWYNESFIQMLKNSPQQVLNSKPSQTTIQNFHCSTNEGAPVIINHSPTSIKQVEIIAMPYQRVLTDPNQMVKNIHHEEKSNNYFRQNNFVAKEQEQNIHNNFLQKQYLQIDQNAEPSKYSECVKQPQVIGNYTYQLNCQQFQYSPSRAQLKQSPIQKQCNQQLQNHFISQVSTTHLNSPTANISAIQSPYISNYQISQGLNPQTQYIQVHNPAFKVVQSTSATQSPVSTSPNINNLKTKEEGQFLRLNKNENQEAIKNIPSNNKGFQDSSLNKKNETHFITTNNVVQMVKDNKQIINTSSRSLSPTQKPNITFLNYQQVNSVQKTPPFTLENQQEKTNQIVFINKGLVNRSGSAGSRPNEFQPQPLITQQQLSFTPLVQNSYTNNLISPIEQNKIIITQNYPKQNSVISSNINYPPMFIHASNSPEKLPQNFLNFPGQLEQIRQIENSESINSKSSNTVEINQGRQQYYIKSYEQESFKSSNSENILNYIQLQSKQLSQSKQNNNNLSVPQTANQCIKPEIKNPQPSNQVRSVKCNNNFSKTINNITKTNEAIKETQQQNSSLVIQQLNKLFIDQKDSNNQKSNMISPSPITYQQSSPITYQQQNKRDPFETESYQQTLAKYYHKPDSASKNSQNDQSKLQANQFSLGGGQARLNNNTNTSSSFSSLPKSSLITANFIDYQQKQFQANDQASLFDDEYGKQMKIISQIQSSLNLNTSISLGPQGQTQEQINFYQYQNKKIQDQIDNQNAIRNMRQSEIEEAQNQLQIVKNNNNNNNNNTQIATTQIKRNSFFENDTMENDQNNQLEYSFNNGTNSNKDQQQQTLNIIDEVERRVQNKKAYSNYPYTIDTIKEEDLQSKIGTVNQIIDKATQITHQVHCEGIDFSINNLSITTEKKMNGQQSPDVFTPQQKRIELVSASPSTNTDNDQTYLYSKKSLEENCENNFSTIKKHQLNYYQENQQNQRFQSPIQPEVLQNLNAASKNHQYQIASPVKISTVSQNKNIQ
ncbi:hypothetical protein ABPG74_014141 [Tetrahymena malaccensis]